MADRPIRDLPSVSTPTGQILFPVDQGGEAMKLSLFDINDFCNEDSSGSGGVVVTALLPGVTSRGTASMGADEIYEYVQNNTPVSLLINRGYENIYVEARLSHVNKSANGINYTAYFYQDVGETDYAILWAVDENKNILVSSYLDFWQIGSQDDIYVGNNGQHLYLKYEPTDDEDAVNKAYVDSLIASGVASDNVVIYEVDENLKVTRNSEAAKGSQINNVSTTGKVVFLWDSDNGEFYQYAGADGSGAATFVAPSTNGNGSLVYSVAATTNNATFTHKINLPVVSASDEGKVLGVVNGAWAKMELTDGDEVSY